MCAYQVFFCMKRLTCLYITFQSAMLVRDKMGRAHELYQLFNQYPEELLLQVFSAMKDNHIITKIKKVTHHPNL